MYDYNHNYSYIIKKLLFNWIYWFLTRVMHLYTFNFQTIISEDESCGIIKDIPKTMDCFIYSVVTIANAISMAIRR